MSTPEPARSPGRFHGLLAGLAIGDALAAPLEASSFDFTLAHFGPGRPGDFIGPSSKRGHITDATQMALFTVEGLIRGHNRLLEKGIGGGASIVHLQRLLTLG